MALADPQSVTVGGSAKSLARVGMSSSEGVFADPTGEYSLVASNSKSKTRRRVMAKFTDVKLGSDPYVPANNIQTSASVHIVLDTPLIGYSNADLLAIAKGFVASLSDAQLTKLIAGEV